MRLNIKKTIHDKEGFNYIKREYTTDDDNIILDFLNEYDGEGNISQWIESNLNEMICLGNNISVGCDQNKCTIIDYKILFENDKQIKHFMSVDGDSKT